MNGSRRLYSWLLGAEVNINAFHTEHPLLKKINALPESHNHTEAYFELYSYDILAEAIRVTLTQSSTEIPMDIKPYRLLTSLFDKPQIGPVVLDSILYDVFRALYLTSLHQQKHKNSAVRCVSFNGDIVSLKGCDNNILNKQFLSKNCQELVKNANLLFNTLEPHYIWLYVGKLYEDSVSSIKIKKKITRDRCQVNEIGSGIPNLLEVCILAEFLLDVIHIETYTDNTSEILPNLFMKIITVTHENIGLLNKHEITKSLELCTKVLTKIQPITIKNIQKSEIDGNTPDQVDNTELNQTDIIQLETPQIDIEELISENKEVRLGLEKSKSDSKINENLNKNELTIDDSSRERSNSNQMLKKNKVSPKIDKKSKNKKSKSSSKLDELKKGELNESTSSENISPEKREPPVEILDVTVQPNPTKIENKHIFKCLELYKKFYVDFLQFKIAPGVKIDDFFNILVQDKEERTRDLEKLLNKCLNTTEFMPLKNSEFSLELNSIRAILTTKDYKSSEYETAMSLASNVLLEFSAFPNLVNENKWDDELPLWLRALIVCACCSQKATKDVQIISMNTLLELFSLAKSQFMQMKQTGTNNGNTSIVVMGILEYSHVYFIEESTFIVEVIHY